jgi:hypothetical protein
MKHSPELKEVVQSTATIVIALPAPAASYASVMLLQVL